MVPNLNSRLERFHEAVDASHTRQKPIVSNLPRYPPIASRYSITTFDKASRELNMRKWPSEAGHLQTGRTSVLEMYARAFERAWTRSLRRKGVLTHVRWLTDCGP